jgi:hypothetical protein
MMVEVDRFYEQECTPEMFERGYGKIPWPTPTKLSSLLSKFLDGDEMKSRSFPEEWSADFYRKKKVAADARGAEVAATKVEAVKEEGGKEEEINTKSLLGPSNKSLVRKTGTKKPPKMSVIQR